MKNKIIIFLFFLAISLPLILHPFSIEDTSQQENREMAQFPDIPTTYSGIRNFFGKIDSYFNDNIPMRSFMISFYNTCYYQIGVSPSKNMIVGKNGWLFNNANYSVDQFLGRKVLSRKQTKDIGRVLSDNYNYFESRNIPFHFVIAPDKHSIYSEYLPDYFNAVKPHTKNYDKVVNYLKKNTELKPIDIRSKLLSEKVKKDLLYFKTDSHWNGLGAFIAYKEIMRTINLGRSELNKLRAINFSHVNHKYIDKSNGGLSKMLGSLAENTERAPFLKLKVNRITSSKLVGPKRKYSAKEKKVITTSTKNGLTLLLIRDSFSSAMIPYYANAFSKIITIHHENGNWDTSVLKEHKPDVVIFQMVERFLSKNFVDTRF